MTYDPRRFYELWGEVSDLLTTEEILRWDQETMMPQSGHVRRGHVLATLAGLRHRLLTSSELADEVAAGLERAARASLEHEQLAVARREIDRATAVPERLVQALAAAASVGLVAWQRARQEKSFAVFAPALERIVELRREEAQIRAMGDHPYDGLLDEYEPGLRTARLAPLFDRLSGDLAALVAAASSSGVEVDESAARGAFPREAQLAFGAWAAARIGFDLERGRLDASTHPFCTGLDPGDVRLTWRWDERDFRPGLFGILHEAGHGLYEQGLPVEWRRRPLGIARSMSLHESQSRLWENHVGRHADFWIFAAKHFRQHFPAAPTHDPESLWRAVNRIAPGPIRVDADEVTYIAHILVRFRLELALIGGEIAVAELPAAWNDGYRTLLGLEPRDDAEGVLQDIHWATGLFGYFPTYALGSLASAQLYAAAERDLGALGPRFAAGEPDALLRWLREHVHRHGSRYTADELLERATGAPLSPQPFLAYARGKVDALYGVAP
ncbi:MAG TPA: carboxypeptidase M32 [Thermoanaerobaculia bacterium]|nr:carboxypeptidase M32 [Thermoanaerobaculia bacterium]